MKKAGDRSIGRSGDRVGSDTLTLCHPERARVESRETSASRRTPVLPLPGIAASGSSPYILDRIRRSLQNGSNVLRAVFREIFDESAYERFLRRANARPSVASYRAFQRERENAIAQKPRCC